jgi:hypothetical protein
MATHVTELRKPPCCMTISVCPLFVLIMMLENLLILPYLLCHYEKGVNRIVSYVHIKCLRGANLIFKKKILYLGTVNFKNIY